MNRQQMAQALRGNVPTGGGMVQGTQLDMSTPAQAPQGGSGGWDGINQLAGAVGKKAGTPTIGAAADMYGPEVAKMGGEVTASPMANFLSKLF